MKKTLVSLSLIAFFSMGVAAQADLTSDNYYNPLLTGVPSLSITPDATAGGMGDIGVSTLPDVSSQHWNSSKYALAESSAGIGLSYTPWLRKLVSDIDLAYLSGYYRNEKLGALSASLRYFSLGNVILKQTANDPGIGAKPYELAFDLGYSRQLAENFAMGVTMRFIASDLSIKDENYHTGYGFSADVNGFYLLPIDLSSGTSKLGIGFNLSNIGTKISYDQDNTRNFIPANLRLGATYYIPFDKYNRISVSAEANKLLVPTRKSKYAANFDANDQETWKLTDDEYNDISVMQGIFRSFNDAPSGGKEELKEIMWSLGLEYAYNEQFFARVGYCNESEDKGNRKFFTVGAGFKLSAFRFDLGYVIARAANSPLDNTLRFSLSFDVDGIRELADRK
ncbi:MAG: type IX secretion system outer membrane channel protein PorV [Prevotellaceae bacterium]|nr:type IX secretion system outer membrane channel protein PorV [Prevotellaceae bacterium]